MRWRRGRGCAEVDVRRDDHGVRFERERLIALEGERN